MLLKIHLDSCRVERDRSGEERKAFLESLVFVFLLRKLQTLYFQIQFHCKNPCGDWLTGGLAARLCSYYFQSYLIWKWQLAVLRILGSLSSSKHFSSAIHSNGNCAKFLGDEEEGAKIQNCIQRDICRPVRPSVWFQRTWSRIWVATHIFLFSTMLLSCVPAGECRTRFTFQPFQDDEKKEAKDREGNFKAGSRRIYLQTSWNKKKHNEGARVLDRAEERKRIYLQFFSFFFLSRS